jgi:predicted nucleic acid-binding protein
VAIALAGHASALATGDADLLTLATYGNVRIVTVADFEERGLSASTPET